MFRGTVVADFHPGQEPLFAQKTAEDSPVFQYATKTKRKLSDQRRLAAVHERFRKKPHCFQQQQKIISQAIQLVDVSGKQETNSKTNKKIRFSDDDEEDSFSPVAKDFPEKKNSRKEIISSKKRFELFQNSDSESPEDTNEIATSFDVPVQYRGAAGQKLLELESKFGGDKRFKMDKKFLADFENSTAEDSTSRTNGEDSLSEEKLAQLKILERVTGKGIEESSGGKKKKRKFDLGASVRFDPDKSEHSQYKLSKEMTEQKNISHNLSDSEDISEIKDCQTGDFSDDKSDTRFHYHIDAEFAHSLSQKVLSSEKEEPFSLLASFGRQTIVAENSEGFSQQFDPENEEIAMKSWQKEILHQSSSVRYADKADTALDLNCESAVSSKMENSASTRNTFFVADDDKELLRAVRKFCRTEDMPLIQKKWQIYRDSLVKSYKRQRKEAMWRKKQRQRAHWTKRKAPKK